MKCNIGMMCLQKAYNLPYLQHQYQFFFVLIIQIFTCLHEELQY